MNFQTSVVITAAEAVAGKTFFARFCSSVKALTISGPSANRTQRQRIPEG
jgi:hypothetical protein